MSWRCPICDAEVVTDYSDTLEGVLCEYADHCPNGCLESDYAYGSTRERVGDREWHWHYTETPEEERKRRQERQAAIEELKQKRRVP